MSDSIFALFLGFALIWIVMGFGGIVLLMRLPEASQKPSQNQPLRLNADALLVSLPILIVFLIALSFGTVMLAKGG